MLAALLKNSTADKLTALMSGAAATTNPTYSASYLESGNRVEKLGSLNGVTAVDMVPTPETQMRSVESLRIHNCDTAAVTVTLQRIVGATTYQIGKVTLQPSDTLIFEAGSISVVDSSGNTKGTNSAQLTQLSIGASTAAAGTTTTDAGVLPAGTAQAYPTTAADGTKGVRINAADNVTGRQIEIVNGANAVLKIYPPTGGTINQLGADAAYSTTSAKGAILFCTNGSTGAWMVMGG
jgi:hypothetical protein